MKPARSANEIRDSILPLQRELQRVESRERQTELRALIGKYFKYPRNCYSLPKKPSDYWPIYALVVGHDGYYPRTFEFQYTGQKEIIIKEREQNPSILRRGGWEPCSQAEFERAWRRIAKKVAAWTPDTSRGDNQ